MITPPLREACELVFRNRNTHSWPPDLSTVPAHWVQPFAPLAEELELAETDVEVALVGVRDFVAPILSAARHNSPIGCHRHAPDRVGVVVQSGQRQPAARIPQSHGAILTAADQQTAVRGERYASYRAGMAVQVRAWDDPTVGWSRFDAAILR